MKPLQRRSATAMKIDSGVMAVSAQEDTVVLNYLYYESVEEVSRDRLMGLAKKTKGALKKAIKNVHTVGKNLLEAQSILKDEGNFVEWLDSEFGLSSSSAYNMISVARRWESSRDVPELGQSVLYLIAPESAPSEAVEIIVERAPNVSFVEAKNIIAEHKPAKKGKKKKPPTEAEKSLKKALDELYKTAVKEAAKDDVIYAVIEDIEEIKGRFD